MSINILKVNVVRDWTWAEFSAKPNAKVRKEFKELFAGRFTKKSPKVTDPKFSTKGAGLWYFKAVLTAKQLQAVLDKHQSAPPPSPTVTTTAIEQLETIVSRLEEELDQAMQLLEELKETA